MVHLPNMLDGPGEAFLMKCKRLIKKNIEVNLISHIRSLVLHLKSLISWGVSL